MKQMPTWFPPGPSALSPSESGSLLHVDTIRPSPPALPRPLLWAAVPSFRDIARIVPDRAPAAPMDTLDAATAFLVAEWPAARDAGASSGGRPSLGGKGVDGTSRDDGEGRCSAASDAGRLSDVGSDVLVVHADHSCGTSSKLRHMPHKHTHTPARSLRRWSMGRTETQQRMVTCHAN